MHYLYERVVCLLYCGVLCSGLYYVLHIVWWWDVLKTRYPEACRC